MKRMEAFNELLTLLNNTMSPIAEVLNTFNTEKLRLMYQHLGGQVSKLPNGRKATFIAVLLGKEEVVSAPRSNSIKLGKTLNLPLPTADTADTLDTIPPMPKLFAASAADGDSNKFNNDDMVGAIALTELFVEADGSLEVDGVSALMQMSEM